MLSPDFIDGLRSIITHYYKEQRTDPETGLHRDPFIRWFKSLSEPRVRIRLLLILIDARFDQGTTAERALENTKAVYKAGLLERRNPGIEEIPDLKPRSRVSAERWRRSFCVALPKLQRLAAEIASQCQWQAGQLVKLIAERKVPFFGPKTARLAVRWIHELIPEIPVDMRDSEVPVDSLLYRVASRLGLIDPKIDTYTGPGSPGHIKIQAVAKTLFPGNPSLMDEPLWMMARKPRNGGFCHPTNPSCSRGCIFEAICPRLWIDMDPVEVGYGPSKNRQSGVDGQCGGQPPGSAGRPAGVETALTTNGPRSDRDRDLSSKWMAGVSVVVACVKKKIWDVKPTSPPLVPAEEAYCSTYFLKNREYARRFGEGWCILSAKFGFVLPDEPILNYDVSFTRGCSGLVDQYTLRKQIREKGLDRYKAVQVLGGSAYVARAREAFRHYGIYVADPLKDLRIGDKMKAVQSALDRDEPFPL